jgi:hypothetical protein
LGFEMLEPSARKLIPHRESREEDQIGAIEE